ncbi:hypothetical protein D3C80_2096030 [compost metagenome]
MQLAHGEGPHQQIDLIGLHPFAAGGAVLLRRRDEGHFRGVLAGRRLGGRLDKPHAQGPGNPDRLEAGQGLGVAVDLLA